MDVNGTRFHLVLGRDDWLGDAAPAGVEWDADGAAARLERTQFVFPARGAQQPPGESQRRGAARDRFGHWYRVGEDRRSIVALAPGAPGPLPFWPPPSPPPCATTGSSVGDFSAAAAPSAPATPELAGLAVTADHYLVVGSVAPAGLLVFDLHAGGPPAVLRWPDIAPFRPADIAASPDGGVWVLDAAHRRAWALDRHFRVRAPSATAPSPPRAPDFRPLAPGPAPRRQAEMAPPAAASGAVDLTGVPSPVAIEALPGGAALVLGADAVVGGAVLGHCRPGDGLVAVHRVAALLAEEPAVLAQLERAHDLAFVADADADADAEAGAEGRTGVGGRLFLVASGGDQAFAFRVDEGDGLLRLAFERAYYPMRRFGGRALVAVGGAAHYDSGERWPELTEYPQPSHVRAAVLALPARGGAFDGGEPGCVWHRLLLDGCVPPGTGVVVESRAADDVAALELEAWQTEPAPYRRAGGSEIAFHALAGQGEGAGTWELLFQNARGRLLQLRLSLHGSGRTTPRLHALRVHYPRFSYLERYLPAVYREDAGSASFLERYLANVEGTFTGIEGRIAAAQTLFDPRTAPAEYLAWLGGWLGAALDGGWSEAKRRFFVAHAVRLHAGRGTRPGLVRALRLALEPCVDDSLFDDAGAPASAGAFGVRVVERFLTRRYGGIPLGDVAGPAAPVLAPSPQTWTPDDGADALHARFRGFLGTRYPTVAALNLAWGTGHASLDAPSLRFAPLEPSGGAAAADWRGFVAERLGFTYLSPRAAELPLYREYLAHRHRQPSALNHAWQRAGASAFTSFADVGFPQQLPALRAELRDWIGFVSHTLPLARAAHRFTVLVPARLDESAARQAERLAVARRVAELERPAHTAVEVRLYWAAFRVGEARLGRESVLGEGSRFAAIVLGAGALAEGHLGFDAPWNVEGRRVVGRDAAGAPPQSWSTPKRWT